MRSRQVGVAVAVALGCASARDRAPTPAGASDGGRDAFAPATEVSIDGAPLPAILYVHRWSIYKHTVLEHSVDVLRDVGAGVYRLEDVDDTRTIDLARLPSYAAVVMFLTGEVSVKDSEKAPLVDYVARGGGLVALHSCSDAMRAWPEWTEMIGARFQAHPWHEDVTVVVDDAAHPAARGLPPRFDLYEETYVFQQPLPGSRVFLSLDESSVPVVSGLSRPAWGYPLAWSRRHGEGTVVYSALGHGVEAWDDRDFRAHLRAAVVHAMRR